MARILLIAIIAIFISSEQLVGQTQSNRRGRFFQKLRDDIFGTQKKPTTGEADLKKAQQQLQQQRTQQGRTPTPLGQNNPTSGRTPTPLNAPNARSPYSPNSSNARSQTPSRSYQYNRQQAPDYKYRPTSSSSPRKKSSNRNGFGFRINMNDKDQLIVASVDRSGNAAEAGLRRGDRIIEIGGIEATSVEEFEEISKIMGQGDQMEFKVKRGGRDSKMNIQFGNMPEPEETASTPRSVAGSGSSRNYDFAPPREPKNSRSVLDRRDTNSFSQASSRQIAETTSRQIQQLNQTIVNQHRQIQELKKELEQIKRGYRSR